MLKETPVFSIPILSFSLATFILGFSEFIAIGLLTVFSNELNVSIGAAGLFITSYALGISIGAPTLAYFTRNYNTKPLCIIFLSIFTLINLVIPFIHHFYLLLAIRLGAGAIHGVFFSIACAYIPILVGFEKSSSALAIMFMGLTLAMVLGVPIGIVVVERLGLGVVFYIIGTLSIINILLILVFLPNFDDGKRSVKFSKGFLLNRIMIGLYSVTIFAFGGGFIFFSYIEPFLSDVKEFSIIEISQSLFLVGIGSLVGNMISGKLQQKYGLKISLIIVILLQIVMLVFLSLLQTSYLFTLIILFMWSISIFSTAPMVQTAVVIMSSDQNVNPRVSAGLNACAFNIGISGASYIGGIYIQGYDMKDIPMVSSLIVFIALLVIGYSKLVNKN